MLLGIEWKRNKCGSLPESMRDWVNDLLIERTHFRFSERDGDFSEKEATEWN